MILVLIESDWNLKLIQKWLNLLLNLRINRIRLEFKVRMDYCSIL